MVMKNAYIKKTRSGPKIDLCEIPQFDSSAYERKFTLETKSILAER